MDVPDKAESTLEVFKPHIKALEDGGPASGYETDGDHTDVLFGITSKIQAMDVMISVIGDMTYYNPDLRLASLL